MPAEIHSLRNRRNIKSRRYFAMMLFLITTGCALIPPRRQYIRDVRNQKIPDAILNTTWALVSSNHGVPDCTMTLTFLEKGKLVFVFKNDTLSGDELWYLVKDASIMEFHLHPTEKIVSTTEVSGCRINPSSVALDLEHDRKFTLVNDILTILTSQDGEFVFRRARFQPLQGRQQK
jgi:hypothetical protein